MDFKQVNKKRKLITSVSIILTFLIVGSYVLSIILFASSFPFIPLIGLVILLALLYCLSKFFVYKYYLGLKTEIVNLALCSEVKCKKIVNYTDKNDFILHFYSKNEVNTKSKFRFVYEDYVIDTEEFEVTEKRNFKSDKVVSSGKYIKFLLNNNHDDVVFIKSHEKETDKYASYYGNLFAKKDDNFSYNKKRYICLYNNQVDAKILQVLDRINSFQILSINNNVVEIIFIDNTPIFDFKLQQSISSTTVHAASQCLNKLTRVINSIRKDVNNV